MVTKIQDQITEHVSRELVMDDSRTKFVTVVAGELQKLHDGTLKSNRFRKLLLGRKNVGKTVLVKSLLNACITDFVCIYENLQTSGGRSLPFKRIWNELNKLKLVDSVPDETSCEDLIEQLHKCGKNVFFVVDEFQLIFSNKFERTFSVDYTSEMCTLADSRDGRIHCIITGSSSVLRRLCFAKYTPKQANDPFPHYIAIDMNSTKFQPYWIYPHLGAPFLGLVARYHRNLDVGSILNCYIQSGCCAGLVEMYPNFQPYTVSIKSYMQ